jgi:hypothetical protein
MWRNWSVHPFAVLQFHNHYKYTQYTVKHNSMILLRSISYVISLIKSSIEFCLTVYCVYLQFYTTQWACLTWKSHNYSTSSTHVNRWYNYLYRSLPWLQPRSLPRLWYGVKPRTPQDTRYRGGDLNPVVPNKKEFPLSTAATWVTPCDICSKFRRQKNQRDTNDVYCLHPASQQCQCFILLLLLQ